MHTRFDATRVFFKSGLLKLRTLKNEP